MPIEHLDVFREVAWHEGDVVRKLRSAAHWTLEELAERAGLNLTVIHDLEAGRTKEAKLKTRTKIAQAFGLTVREFEDLVPTQPVRLSVNIDQPAKTGREGIVDAGRRQKGGTRG